MSKLSTFKARGLNFLTSGVGSGEQGYMTTANNVLINQDGVIESRYATSDVGSTNASANLFYDTLHGQILRCGNTVALEKSTGGAFSTLDSTTNDRYQTAQASNGFLYLLNSTGLRKINTANSATEIAYVPEGLDIQATLTGSGGWFLDQNQVAYRIVWGIIQNNRVFLGAPSGRGVIRNNSASATNVSLTFTVPSGITTSHFYQVYRSPLSGGVDTSPADDMRLIYEAFYVSGTTVTFVDYVPVGAGGTALYTSPGQEGALEANYPCEATSQTSYNVSLASYASCLWTNGYNPRSSLDVYLLSVLTPTGLNARTFTGTLTASNNTITAVSDFTGLAVGMVLEAASGDIAVGTTILSMNTGAGTITMSTVAIGSDVGDTITAGDPIVIGGTTYTAWTSEDLTTRRFLVSTAAVAAQAIRETCESFVKIFNRATANTILYAAYASGENELPGHIYFWARTDRASTYTIQCVSHGAAFSPNITTATTILSEDNPGRLIYSKPDEPQAWPPDNYFIIPEGAEIAEIHALRGALMIWTNRGLYRLTGTYGDFALTLVDASLTATQVPGALLNNVSYKATAKGICAASEAGVQIISDRIPQLRSYGSAAIVADAGKQILYAGLQAPPLNVNITYVYNPTSDTWTTYSTSATGNFVSRGAYNATTKLMYLQLGSATYTQVGAFEISSPLASTAYLENSEAATIVSHTDTTVTLSGAPTGDLQVGDYVTQSGNYAMITSIDSSTWTLTLTNATAFLNAGCVLYIGFSCSIQWHGLGEPSPSITKNLRYINALIGVPPLKSYLTNSHRYYTFAENTDLSQTTTNTTTVTQTVQGNIDLVRSIVPTTVGRCSVVFPSLSWRNTLNGTRIAGLEIDYTPISDKTR